MATANANEIRELNEREERRAVTSGIWCGGRKGLDRLEVEEANKSRAEQRKGKASEASERRRQTRTRASQPFLPRLIPTFPAVHSSLYLYAPRVRIMIYVVYSCPKPSVSL